MYNQRNIIPPTLQQTHNRSGDICNNRNSQSTDNNVELRRYSGYTKKASTGAMEKQRALNLENEDNW
jgi:hypothetical protein